MTNQDRYRAFRLAMLLDGNFDNLKTLHRLNARLHTLAERSCNGEGWYSRNWNISDEARFRKSWDNAQSKARTILAGHGFTLFQEQGDPRGWGMFEATNPVTNQTFRINY